MSEHYLPDSYREQHGCHNCWKLLENRHLHGVELKCSLGIPPGQLAMTWAMPTVEPHGICDEWEGD